MFAYAQSLSAKDFKYAWLSESPAPTTRLLYCLETKKGSEIWSELAFKSLDPYADVFRNMIVCTSVIYKIGMGICICHWSITVQLLTNRWSLFFFICTSAQDVITLDVVRWLIGTLRWGRILYVTMKCSTFKHWVNFWGDIINLSVIHPPPFFLFRCHNLSK